MRIERKTFRLDIKEISDEGRFTGTVSLYGVKDLGGDVIEKGAFTKTIRDHKGRFKVLHQHNPDEPIGLAELTETAKGIVAEGQLNMDLQLARDVHSNLKKGILDSLSHGFNTIKDEMREGVRYIKEVKLWEISIVTFPMLPQAGITDVKSTRPGEQKRSFEESLELIDLYAKRYQLINALCDSLDSIVWMPNVEQGEKIQQIDESIEQFHAAYIDFIPRYLEALAADMERYSDNTLLEMKAAQPFSGEARARISGAIENLKALLERAEAAPSTPTVTEAAPVVTVEPDLHSMARQIAAEIRHQLAV